MRQLPHQADFTRPATCGLLPTTCCCGNRCPDERECIWECSGRGSACAVMRPGERHQGTEPTFSACRNLEIASYSALRARPSGKWRGIHQRPFGLESHAPPLAGLWCGQATRA